MQGQGKIAQTDGDELRPWQPDIQLAEPGLGDVRFSLGFLRAQPERWFESCVSLWLPLFHVLGLEVRKVEVSTGFDFPENLDRITPMEIDGEVGVIGMDSETERFIVQSIAPGCSDVAADLVVEYIERRFISTLSKSWSGEGSLNCFYISPDKAESAEVVGNVQLTVIFPSGRCILWLGVGPRLLERIDLLWREHLGRLGEALPTELEDDLHTISVELAELAVPPAMLIDYMRSGTVIDLGIPIATKVTLRLRGEPWASGELYRFNGRFAVQITNLNPRNTAAPEGTTRLQVEIGRAVLDRQGIVEHSQLGAFLLTSTPINSTAVMLISGENVANAVVGEINGHFALNVLPK